MVSERLRAPNQGIGIEVVGLRKSYRRAHHHRGFVGALRNLFESRSALVEAVAGISFSIRAGEFVGFIGPNGAGKSTTIKMLTGVLEPSSGTIDVGGFEPRRDRVAFVARIGVVFGQRTQLWWDLPVVESFSLLRQIYAIEPHHYREQVERLSTLLGVGELLDVPVRKLSLGQRMRCELAAALLHRPRLLFLDEPTIGLDVIAKTAIREFLAEENRERGTTVLLTTHDLADVEQLCPRMILIDHGRIVYDGSVVALKRQLGEERVLRVEFDGPAPTRVPATVEELERGPSRLVLRFRRDELAPADLIAELARGRAIADLSLHEPPIERIVAEIYGRGSLGSGSR